MEADGLDFGRAVELSLRGSLLFKVVPHTDIESAVANPQRNKAFSHACYEPPTMEVISVPAVLRHS